MGVGGQSHSPTALPPLERDTIYIVENAEWVPGWVWTGVENLASTGILSLYRPGRNDSLYRLSYPSWNINFLPTSIFNDEAPHSVETSVAAFDWTRSNFGTCSMVEPETLHGSVTYRISRKECARPRQNVPYVKVHRYNPKHLYPKWNGYGDNGERSLKV